LTSWQVYALVLAGLTPIAAVIGTLRARKWSHALLLAQMVLLAEVGLVVYAISPGPEPQETPLLWLALALIAIAFLVMGWTFVARRKMLRRPISLAELDRANYRALLNRFLTISAVSCLLLNFEPWLGVANLVANAIWICIWIPKRMRAYGMAASLEIAAPPQAIFPYLIDPTRWPLYRASSDVQVVSVEPPGPLALRSRIMTRRPATSGRHVKPYTVESTTEVTEFVPDRSYSTVSLDRPSEHSTTELHEVPSGTSLQFRLVGITGFWPATIGLTLDLRGLLSKRRAEVNSDYVRLKEILEPVPSR
jgi:hypothetical protein